jgi:hypothetical protein
VGQGARVVAGPARRQGAAQFRPGQRGPGEQSGRGRAELGPVDAGQVPAEDPSQGAAHHGLEQGAEAEEILGVHQVDRVAHEVGAEGNSFGQKIFEVLGTETGQPGLEPDVRSPRGLGLQAGQVGDGLAGGQCGRAEQELAAEGGAVQRPEAQLVSSHGAG